MAVVRANIRANTSARDDYIKGVKLLKTEFTGPTTASLGIPGPSTQVSTYDLFVVWHHFAMTTFTPPTQSDRNAAHRGPVFLPWHRFMLLQLEMNLQRVLNDNTFGLPYWIGLPTGSNLGRNKKRPPFGLARVWVGVALRSQKGRSRSRRLIQLPGGFI
jgi:tyrosinase